MKIFYAVQATGNGHISRAMELLPYLRQHGTVDIFLSGDNSHLAMDAPVKYRSKGLSLYYNATGGLDYWKMIRCFHPVTLRKEINELPVEKYDLVINDFEYITGAACAKKKIPSVQLGHQASFQSKLTPRPAARNAIGEWILKNYAKATHHIGLHFDQYDNDILPPVIKEDILHATPVDKGHITVYLPAYAAPVLEKIFNTLPGFAFHVFVRNSTQAVKKGNVTFFPVNKSLFDRSMTGCHAIICGAGFETPAEALYLRKKMLCIPTRGQYEQLCNAAALEKLGVACIKKIDAGFPALFHQWIESRQDVPVKYGNSVPALMEKLFSVHASMEKTPVAPAFLPGGERQFIPVAG